jgi:alpha-L-fucosidase
MTKYRGITNDGGNSGSPYFSPAVCDTTLQTDDRWFYGVNQPLRSIEELIAVYQFVPLSSDFNVFK